MQATQNTVAKKRAGHDVVDAVYLFANFLLRPAFRRDSDSPDETGTDFSSTGYLFPALPSDRATRILEKQKSLQMSQVFPCVCALVIRWFCFSRILTAGPRNR